MGLFNTSSDKVLQILHLERVPERAYAYVDCKGVYTISGEWRNECLNGAWKHPFAACVGNDNFIK